MSFREKQKTANIHHTIQIIGGVLIAVGIVSLLRGEKSILGVGILVGLFMLLVPFIFVSGRFLQLHLNRGRTGSECRGSPQVWENWPFGHHPRPNRGEANHPLPRPC
jgi:hypothetical protein